MPVGYLIGSTVLVLTTFAALTPIRRPWGLGIASWLLAMVVNELTVIYFAWHSTSTITALAEGDVQGAVGWTAFILSVVALAGLAVVAWRGFQTGPTVRHALAAEFGTGWHSGARANTVAQLRRRMPSVHALLAPFWLWRHDVRSVKNIRYGTAGKRNLLDVYRPQALPDAAPILIYFHGGGYFAGWKNLEARALLRRMAGQGWVCISATYRLRPRATFDDHLIDVKKVIAWARRHGPDYGADPRVVLLAGSSAGAHLASLAALTPGDPAFQPGFETTDTSVAGAVCLYGYYGNYYGRGPETSPVTHVNTDSPPFFIAHGTHDTYTPVSGARRLVQALRRTSAAPVVYAELHGAQHSFDLFLSPRFEKVVAGVEVFAERVRDDVMAPAHR